MEEIRPIILDEIQLGLFDPAVRLTAKGQLYGNPLVMGVLEKTASSTGYLVFGRRGESTIVLQWSEKKAPGAVKVRRRNGERTATWTFGPVLALFPMLKVEKGYVRRFPFRVEDGKLMFEVTGSEVVPSKRKK